MKLILANLGFLVLSPLCAWAQDVVKPFKPEEFAVRFAYHYELLDSILERTTDSYGNYVEQSFREPVSTARSLLLAVEGQIINVYISDPSHKLLNEGMIPIPIPVEKGLLGVRVPLIAEDNRARIAAVRDIDNLRKLVVGMGATWGNVPIYKYNHVPIETAPTYESLFLMLIRGRFDLFPRGVTEAPQELKAFGGLYPGLAIDRHLLIRYLFGQFFYVAKSEPRLAQRIREGLEAMVRDGSLDVLFQRYFGETIRSLDLSKRVVIELENPFLPDWVPVDQPEFWLDWKSF